MTTAEQAERTARNVLELVHARRQLAAVYRLAWPENGQPDAYQLYTVDLGEDGMELAVLVDDLRGALAGNTEPKSSNPEEVSA